MFLILFLPYSLQAQELRYQLRQFTPNDGLPSSEAHSILRDSKNYLWIATDHGVCRYDGYSFETFNLPDNSVLSLYEDHKKRIWVLTFSGQLFIYENDRFYPYKYNNTILKLQQGRVYDRIAVDLDGTVCLVLQFGGQITLDPSGNVRSDFEESDHLVYKSYQSKAGEYITYAKTANAAKRTHISSILELSENGKDHFIRLTELVLGKKSNTIPLQNGGFLFYSGAYLLKINGKSFAEKKIGAEILDAFEDKNGRIWVSTALAGFFILDKELNIKEHYLNGLTVTSIETDHEEGMWFSTSSQGIFYLRTTMVRNLNIRNDFFNYPFTELAAEGDSVIWIGSISENLYRYNIVDDRIEIIKLPVAHIYDIVPEPTQKKIYVAASNSPLYKNDPFKPKRFRDNEIVPVFGFTQLIRSGNGFIVGTIYGINDNDSLLLTEKMRVSTIYRDSHKRLLIGNNSGLWYVSNRSTMLYDSSNKVLRSRITDIGEFRNKYLCLGTRGNGFIIIFADSLYQLSENDGLASNNIRKIYFDGSYIWIATNKGISRLSVSFNPTRFTIQNIGVQEGLLSNEINDILQVNKQVFISSNAGLTVMDAAIFSKESQHSMPFYISSVKINGESVKNINTYNLTYKQRKLELFYTALSYRSNGDIQYRYRLSKPGFTWSYTSARDIVFDPLPYGDYKLEIQAKMRDGIWAGQNQLSIDFTVRPPFWRAIWFIVLAILIVAAAIFMIVRWRIMQIRRKEEEKTAMNKKLVEMEMKALRAQMNPHFIFNVLSSIQYYILYNDSVSAQNYLSKFARLIRITLDNSRVTFVSLEKELTLLKLYLDLENLRFEEKFMYEIDVDAGINQEEVLIPNFLLQPYVENAIKHGFRGRPSSFLSVRLWPRQGKIVCTITDNGVGRVEAAKAHNRENDVHTSAGTLIIRDKIEALKIHFNYHLSSDTIDVVEEGVVKGTQVVLEFPEIMPYK
jgi:ligand-binding sensor domain-containing protein/anti-sigma regulatory factor (Ser/Thr protein kinase)